MVGSCASYDVISNCDIIPTNSPTPAPTPAYFEPPDADDGEDEDYDGSGDGGQGFGDDDEANDSGAVKPVGLVDRLRVYLGEHTPYVKGRAKRRSGAVLERSEAERRGDEKKEGGRMRGERASVKSCKRAPLPVAFKVGIVRYPHHRF